MKTFLAGKGISENEGEEKAENSKKKPAKKQTKRKRKKVDSDEEDAECNLLFILKLNFFSE